MARRKLRVRRKLTVLALIALLLLLLELNRFLPGGWPGGGGEGGFRKSDALNVDGNRSGAKATRLSPPDPIDDLVKALGKDAVLIQVFDADGNELSGWRVGIGDGGAEDLTPSKQTSGLRLRKTKKDGATLEGFRVRADGVLAAHMAAGSVSSDPVWRVVLPKAAVPARRKSRPIEVEVRSRRDGTPTAATIEYVDVRGDAQRIKAPEGKAVLPEYARHVKASTADGLHAASFVHPRQGPVVLEIDDTPRRRFTAAAIGSIRGRDGRLLDGAPADEHVRSSGYPEGAWAELHAEVAHGATVAWGELLENVDDDVLLPEHRHLEVFVTDTLGKRLGSAVVRARYALPVKGFDLAEPFFAETALRCGADGRARPAVPTGIDATVLVEADGYVPQVIEVGTETTVLERVKLDAGRPVDVSVVDADGKTIDDTTIVARANVGGVVVDRDARGPFPDGLVEVYATAPGHTWGKALARVGPDAAPARITLERAVRLALVVESPLGLPLEGVEVEVTPTDDGAPLVAPPDATDHRTDARGRIELEQLPNREYRVRLSRPGYQTETLHKIRGGAVTYFTTLVPEK